ncbi:MAG: recombinase family protein [Acidobacteria bacterium]|nr:recombinase family protein [Acidobacteriota bacterium]
MTDHLPAIGTPPASFKRAAFYGRFSTHMQRPCSLDDQLRSCKEFADQAGWAILEDHIYTDSAISGTSSVGRNDYAALKRAADQYPAPFDYVLFDDTSRCARNVEEILGFVKLMKFRKIGVRFVSQKLDSIDPMFEMALQIYAMFDSQLVERIRAKVLSGQKGRVLAGFHVGSVPYGYKSVTIFADNSEILTGRARTLGSKLARVEEQAEVVQRIFMLFVDGYSVSVRATAPVQRR